MKSFLASRPIWIVLALSELAMLIIYPPFRIVALNEARIANEQAIFDPQRFAADFWEQRLMPALERADDAAMVLQAIRHDRAAAKKQYGHVVGLGGPHHFFVKGAGRVSAVNPRSIELRLDGAEAAEADVVLQTSLIFGNQVLNASGLIARSQFPRTNDYNEISAAVNRIVEQQVIPPLLSNLKIGDTVEFTGCSDEVLDDGPLPIPLKLVPIQARLK